MYTHGNLHQKTQDYRILCRAKQVLGQPMASRTASPRSPIDCRRYMATISINHPQRKQATKSLLSSLIPTVKSPEQP